MRRATILASLVLVTSGAQCPAPQAQPPTCSDPDLDGDGVDAVACGGVDCDDTNAARAPGNLEVCDAADVDEDCDPSTFGERDGDGDGYVDADCRNVSDTGIVAQGNDCMDSRADMHPSLAEVCDGLDNDCDGSIDEGVLVTLFEDFDGDGHGGALGATVEACAPLPGYSFSADDCDDTRGDVHPGLPEVCDGADTDCDGTTDDGVSLTLFVDDDQDGFGTTETAQACAPDANHAVRSGDCDDANPAIVNGSMACSSAQDYRICQAGTWSAPAPCPTQQCAAQPNGTGSCR